MRSAACTEFLKLIRRHFSYLFDEYGFTVMETRQYRKGEFCMVFLKSEHALIRFEEELDSVSLLFGPVNAPLRWEYAVEGTRYWYPIRPLLDFLKREPVDYEEILREAERFLSKTLEQQLEELSCMLRPVCAQVLGLFRHDAPAQWRTEYEKYQQEQEEGFRRQRNERLARRH